MYSTQWVSGGLFSRCLLLISLFFTYSSLGCNFWGLAQNAVRDRDKNFLRTRLSSLDRIEAIVELPVHGIMVPHKLVIEGGLQAFDGKATLIVTSFPLREDSEGVRLNRVEFHTKFVSEGEAYTFSAPNQWAGIPEYLTPGDEVRFRFQAAQGSDVPIEFDIHLLNDRYGFTKDRLQIKQEGDQTKIPPPSRTLFFQRIE